MDEKLTPRRARCSRARTHVPDGAMLCKMRGRMAVLVEGFSVIVRKEALERNFPGGLDAYQGQLPNGTYCADEQLCRVAFMAQADAMEHARILCRRLRAPSTGHHPELAIVSAAASHLVPSRLGETAMVVPSRATGQHHGGQARCRRHEFSAPAGWRPPMNLISPEDLVAAAVRER